MENKQTNHQREAHLNPKKAHFCKKMERTSLTTERMSTSPRQFLEVNWLGTWSTFLRKHWNHYFKSLFNNLEWIWNILLIENLRDTRHFAYNLPQRISFLSLHGVRLSRVWSRSGSPVPCPAPLTVLVWISSYIHLAPSSNHTHSSSGGSVKGRRQVWVTGEQ